jgi:flagellar biosynthesis/type III secretory pathway chaperone
MNVYNRPLFRQAGGPAQMMPQDMAQQGMPPQGMAPQGMPPQGGSGVDPQMEQALTAAEQQSAAGMAEVGASYAESMMSGLDNAEDYKTVIDSIRGNALPMEARYSELASLVGEEDARKTPESVLTLIQPTIMMTEQGAMDSGIGELMRQVTGEIDMEAENGMPTEMGQGVGSLMTAGVGQQPTQNFSLGGPVVRMGTGGNPRLEQLSSEILGNYRNIMGDGEDQKKLTQAQILFDIADAAGRFASGTNAQGQSVAGLSPFAQLGAATSGLGGRIGERVGELDKQDRALKLSALGAAQTEYNAEQAAARAAGTKDKFSLTTLYGPEGKPITVNTGNDAGVAEANTLLKSGYTDVAPKENKDSLREVDGKIIDFANVNNPRVVYVSDPKIITQVIGKNILDITDRANIKVIYTDPSSDTKVTVVDGQIIDYTDPNNVRVLYSGTPEIKTTTIGSVLLNITDPKNIVEMYKGPTDRKTTTINGQLIDYTDPANVQVLFGDKTRKYQTVNGKIVDITDPANTSIVFDGSTPDIRIIGRDAIDFSNPANPQTIFTAPAETKTVTIQNNLLDVTDPKNIKILYKADPEMKTVTVEGQVINITDPTNPTVIYGDKKREYKTLGSTLIDVTDPNNPVEVYREQGSAAPFGKGQEGLQLAMLTDETMVAKFESGQLSADEETRFVGALENYIAPKRDQFGTSISNPLPARIIQALRARQEAGLPVSQNIDPALYMPKSEADAIEAIRLIPPDIDITMATGPLGAIQAGLESRLSGASEILPFLPSTSGSFVGGAEALEAKKAVSALAQATERFYTDGRILATEFANIQKELVRPDQVTNDAEALAAFEKQKSLLLQAQQRGNNILANPKSFSVEELRGARQDLAAITQLLPDYTEAIRQYSNKINGTTTGTTGETVSGKPNPANFDRRGRQ